jgi:hypothetical protein
VLPGSCLPVQRRRQEDFAKRPASFWVFSEYFTTELKLQDLMIQTSLEDYQKNIQGPF